jgi:hypothetical protein
MSRFMYFHLTHMVLIMFNKDLPNAPFLRNITPLLHKSLLYFCLSTTWFQSLLTLTVLRFTVLQRQIRF